MKFNPDKIIFRSPHRIEECHRRIKESVDTSFFPYFPSEEVVGKISKHSFSLKRRLSYSNLFQTVMQGSLKPSINGTNIILTLGLHPFVKIFMCVCFGGLIIIECVILIKMLTSFFTGNFALNRDSIAGVLFPPGMAVFMLVFIIFGKDLAHDDSKLLKEFLVELIDAEEIKYVEQAATHGPRVNRGQ